MEPIDQLRRDANMLFTTLTPVKGEDYTCTIPIKVSGYVDLTCIVADLVKASILACNIGAPQVSEFSGSGRININNLLELALQLMPYNEAEFLDDARGLLLGNSVEAVPEWNYCSIKIVEGKAKKRFML